MRYQPHEYACIAAWGRRAGSFDYYIKAQQKLAAEAGAPITAIYCESAAGRKWHTAAEIKDPALRRHILGNQFVEEEHGQYGTEHDVESDRWDRLPRVCAAYEFTEKKAALITRGEAGYTELPADFDVGRFNDQRNIKIEQIMAMLNGSMFGWHIPAADPANCGEEDFFEERDDD